MRYVGIDPSLSRTGLCIIDDAGIEARSLPTSRKLSIYDRQLQIVKSAAAQIRAGDIVVLEEFGISARFAPSGRFVERIEICGMLKFLLPKVTGLPWFSVPPNLLKKFVTGKASSKKDEVISSVRDNWKVMVNNDDEADAFGLAAYARSVFTGDRKFLHLIAKFLQFESNQASFNKVSFLGKNR
jgi:Holliday junction resolvasome RuvABC endonuclease subunit